MGNNDRDRVGVGTLLLLLALCLGIAGGVFHAIDTARVADTGGDPRADTDARRRVRAASRDGDSVQRAEATTERNATTTSATAQRSSRVRGSHTASMGSVAERSPWHRPGLCEGRDAAWERSRAQFLATFVDVNVAEQGTYNARLLAAPGINRRVLLRVARELHVLGMSIQEQLNLPTEPATVYLYPSLEALREYACVHPAASAYYDGAIHLAAPDTNDADWPVWPLRAIRHEYVHHVLMSAGIGEPFWFQEGVAMQIARDNPRPQDFRDEPFSVTEMVGGLDHGDTEDSVLQRYAQSSAMVGFLRVICRNTKLTEATMARALLDHVIDPQNLFDWTAQQCAQDLDQRADTLWENYWRSQRLSDTTQQRVWQRTPPAAAP